MKLTINPSAKFRKNAKAVLTYAGMFISFALLYVVILWIFNNILRLPSGYDCYDFGQWVYSGTLLIFGCALMIFFILLKGKEVADIKLAALAAVCLVLGAEVFLLFEMNMGIWGVPGEYLIYYAGVIIGRNTKLLSPKNAAPVRETDVLPDND